MAISVWRSSARVVAVLDLVFTSIGFLFLVAPHVFGEIFKIVFKVEEESAVYRDGMWARWVLLAVYSGIIMMGMWFSILLFQATHTTENAAQSLARTKAYCNFSVILVIFIVVFNLFVLSQVLACFLGICIRLGFIYVVRQFVKELETKTSPTAPSLDMN